jgi:exonuclease III
MEPSRDASEGDRGSREFAMPSADRRLRAIAKSAPSLASFAIFALCGFAAPRFAAATELRVLSYNVRGVPPVISFLGRPGTRIRHIVEKLDAYDVALLQETFSYQDVIERCAEGEDGCEFHHGPGRKFRWGQVIAAPVLALCWLTPRCRLPANSGLMTVVQPDHVAAERIAAERYERCWGYLIGGNDCFAAKGFVLVRVTQPDGAEVDVYNTHLDAANFRWDRSTRKSQFKELTRAIEDHSRGRAVILAGDFNARRNESSVERLRGALQLEDSSACANSPGDRAGKFDRLFFRSGDTVHLACLRAGEDPSFTYRREGESEDRPLSDHEPLTATFDVSRIPGGGMPEVAELE